MRRSLVVIALGGCSFHSGSSPQSPDGSNPPDASIEMHDAAAGCGTFSSYTDTCVLDLSMPMSIGKDAIYNTDTHVLADFPLGTNATTIDQQIDVSTASGPMNLILASTFSISGSSTLHVVGAKAFGVLAGAAVTLDGDIDGSADLPGPLALLSPAGAVDATHCGTSTPATPPDHGNGAGGGGGAGFRGHGGDGQQGDGGNAPAAPQGASIAMPAGVRGGCPGGAGGSTTSIANGGAGGGGGAAVYLASAGTIAIHGGASINVGGGGGAGGNAFNGAGGGGGSGGMIVLESITIAVQGTLAANGGGGAGGASNSGGAPGQAGLASAMAASGASARDPGGPGADGAAGNKINGADDNGDQPDAGGGGGGGAGGFIVLLTQNPSMAGSTISPQ
ncbi:MAG TPA: hypothetical protein VGO00_19585 [Kofleriaceae bacterium]|nr:hypothetical protein [Kofleriaceae bacterium]